MAKNNKITLSKKYVIIGSLALLAIVSAFTVINTHTQNTNFKNQKLEEIKNLANMLTVGALQDLRTMNLAHIALSIKDIKACSYGVDEIIVFDRDVTFSIGDQKHDDKQDEELRNDPYAAEMFETGEVVSHVGNKQIIVYAPIVKDGELIACMMLKSPLDNLNRMEYVLLMRNIFIGLLVYVVSMLLLTFFVRKIIRPVKGLIEGTRAVAEGDYDKKIEIHTGDELEVLSYSFNRMVEKLKSSHEEMIAALDKAERSDKLKTEFLAQMSHEIRTPVNSIINFTGLIKNEFAESIDDDLASAFSIIENSSTRLVRTIELIVDTAELKTGNFQPEFSEIEIHRDIIAPVIVGFKYTAAGKGLELTCTNNIGSTKIQGDSYSLSQLFTNLVDNAIKYTNEGCVKVNIDFDEQHNVIVEVEDTGIGISEDFIPFLFDPFMQEDQGYTRRFEGTGLGLALVREYCIINNANIFVESEKGKGTKFTVVLKPVNKD